MLMNFSPMDMPLPIVPITTDEMNIEREIEKKTENENQLEEFLRRMLNATLCES